LDSVSSIGSNKSSKRKRKKRKKKTRKTKRVQEAWDQISQQSKENISSATDESVTRMFNELKGNDEILIKAKQLLIRSKKKRTEFKEENKYEEKKIQLKEQEK